MAQYNPPSQNLPIFDSGLFGGTNSNPGSIPSGDFLNFPNAQGDENLLGITVADSATFNADSTFNNVVEINDDTTFSTNIIMSGTYLTNYLEFPDGSQQFSAGGGGDALLDGGSSSTTPQTFTGYNNFSNADGQITLTNTTESPISFVTISCDQTNYQVNIGGNLAIGNTANSNLVMLSSAADYTGQLDIHGYLNVTNGSNTHAVNILTDETNDKQLNIQGALSIGNTTNSNTVVLASDATTGNQLDIDGNVSIGSSYQLSTNQIYYPPNPSSQSNDTTIGQDDNGITINNEFTLISYSTPANYITMYADADVANQLDVIGTLKTSTVKCATVNVNNVDTSILLTCTGTTTSTLNVAGNLLTTGNIILGSGSTVGASLTFGDGSIQTVAYTGGTLLATYTSSALDTGISPYNWSFDGISNSLGNQVNWILYSNSAITVSGASTVYTDLDPIVQPSALNNYIFGSGTAIQIPYKYSDGTTTTTQPTYYPSAVVALGGFSISAIADASVNSTFRVALNSTSNTSFTNGSTLTLKFYAN